jgi:diguanylate cyclase (GGDEF)-like protein
MAGGLAGDMDPRIVFAVVALMMLLNGGVLGLMHRDLPREVRPSAVDWRVGTLLVAGATLLFAAQAALPPGFILPVANLCGFIGFTLYWRAMRRFDGRPDSRWLFAPALLGTLAIYWYAAVDPSVVARIIVSTAVWLFLLCGIVFTLRRGREGGAFSRGVLSAIFIGVGAFLLLRGALVLLRAPGMASTIDAAAWINLISPVVISIIPVIGTTAFLLLCSERQRRQAERAAATDYLTGLPNRRSLMQGGASRLAAARRAGRPLAAALIDIDHFKRINDTHGHETGDLALKHIAALLAAHCRGQLVGRHGGEEFVALFDDAGAPQAAVAAERLRAAVAGNPLALARDALPLTISIGVAVLEPQDREFDDLLRRADGALYAAKAGGRNRVEFAAPPACQEGAALTSVLAAPSAVSPAAEALAGLREPG